jgi:hypothetical protein
MLGDNCRVSCASSGEQASSRVRPGTTGMLTPSSASARGLAWRTTPSPLTASSPSGEFSIARALMRLSSASSSACFCASVSERSARCVSVCASQPMTK